MPLKDEEGKAVFDRGEKCSLLERVFFGGKHLDDCKFDEQFREEVERSIQDNENEMENNISEKSREDMRICDVFLNYEISMVEVEAALQLLKSNKSPGPMKFSQSY